MTPRATQRRTRSAALLRIDLAGLAVIAVITALGYFMGVSPALARRDSLAQQQSVLNARKQEAIETNQTLKSLRREIDHLREGVSQQPLKLLSPQQSNERIDDLSRLVAEHGLTLHEVVNGPITTSPRFQLVPIYISGRGTFFRCSAFLHDLHARYRDLSAWNVELLDNPSDRDATLDFRFDLTWYAAR